MPNITFPKFDHDTKVVLTTIGIISVLLAGVLTAKAYFTPSNSPAIGEQFTEADLEGGAGRIVSIPTACDATVVMIPSLYNEGFNPYSVGSASDVKGKQFAMTFWKRMSVAGWAIIVTTSHDSGITCIISISNNVTDVQEKDGNDGQTDAPRSNYQGEPLDATPI